MTRRWSIWTTCSPPTSGSTRPFLEAIDEAVPPVTDIAGIKHLTGNPPLSPRTAAALLTRHDGVPRPPVAMTEAREMR
ncbi:hypothetical protein [Actinomadura sp. NTSP31]|uniref:hypothetical protein n=1 Tax=Actinomadura sp. NTSP31 TaxID=1735447 RepID=UPI0035C0138C